MTFEQFKQLAVDPPRREEPTLFEVIQFDIIPPDEEEMPPHQKLDISERRVGFGRTLEEAERLMLQSIKESEDNDDHIYCFHIREYPIGVVDGGLQHSLGVSARLYDEEGKLLDRTYCSSLDRDYGTEFGLFRGRGPEQRRFCPGDKAEYLDGDVLRIVEVGGGPLSIERCWEIRESIRTEPRFQKKDGTPLTEEEIDERYCVDWSDDQVTVYYDDWFETEDGMVAIRGGDHFRDHDHVSPIFLRHSSGLHNKCFMNLHRNN